MFTLLTQNWVKLHVIMHVLSAAEMMEPVLGGVCALLWAKFTLLHCDISEYDKL